ncbi:MAG: flagellar biosynthesis anti-sigma factor FlgM [Clostridia bacterium]|nr:flagellar biosynthesis anti-sigma factor FlgM [Clostridia bacterium]
MDVNKINATYGVYNTSKVNKTSAVNGVTKTMGKDKTELTGTAADFTLALQEAMKAPDVREDVVKDIKERMDNGTYDYDIDALVDKLLG